MSRCDMWSRDQSGRGSERADQGRPHLAPSMAAPFRHVIDAARHGRVVMNTASRAIGSRVEIISEMVLERVSHIDEQLTRADALNGHAESTKAGTVVARKENVPRTRSIFVW